CSYDATCDPDDDDDGVADGVDNCPDVPNADQANADGDAEGNACDSDDDNDGVPDTNDMAPLNPRICEDSDSDTCDDCSKNPTSSASATPWPVYVPDPYNDGVDIDSDGLCTAGDPDNDNDGILDGPDTSNDDPDICGDSDFDTCDDCSIGTDNYGPMSDSTPNNDGADFDGDGLCDAGDNDDDNDGYTDDVDCNDLDENINPGTAEVCGDGVDNDCSGAIDDLDFDQDGHLDLACGGDDCNDGDDSIYPGAAEVCNNEDDDCDAGTADGSGETWYMQVTTCGNGACAAAGNFICQSGVKTDTCSAGTGAADDATCDGVDDDCDGSTDEDYVSDTSCFLLGACAASNAGSTCDAGVETVCQTGTPVAETCDNVDNNCDGTTDEGLTQPTSCGVGVCSGNAGQETCAAGVWGGDTCDPFAGSSAETCDNADNDCDGTVDEGLTQATANQDGLCSGNTETCAAGSYIPDGSNYVPVAETCDNADNDCDGTVDEGLTQPTSCGVGVCSGNAGIETCAAGVWGGDTCDPFAGSSSEVCEGSIDEDCDGTVDNGCNGECVYLETQACGSDIGVCQKGTQTCNEFGIWGTCVDEVVPSAELCDGLDNDCDSSTDEDFGNLGNSCSDGVGECYAAGNYVCTSNQLGTECNAVAGTPGTEVCDGLDNDCDGTSDEDYANLGNSCSAGVGECEVAGSYVCTGDNQGTECNAVPGTPGTEVCDNKDNDCDGSIDEGLFQPTTCGVGICASNSGQETCSAGVWSGDTCDAFAG
ncbi:putative metal-binding motif-containing protein, partial [Patescibacteria group bacterium]|nr:putative metal-binding motif-containing protein [Patescibacteria group bacterium]